MNTELNEIELDEVEVAGLDEDVLIRTGDFSNGFFRYDLDVDLEELADGNLDKAFSVDNPHDTCGTSFRSYYGIIQSVTLPDGAKRESVQALCDDIASRAAELTAGFSVEWINGNERAEWDDDAEGAEDAQEFWAGLAETVSNLNCVMTYDLADGDNLNFVRNNVTEAVGGEYKFEGMDDVESALNDAYENDDEWAYFNHAAAAEKIWEAIEEDRLEEEEERIEDEKTQQEEAAREAAREEIESGAVGDMAGAYHDRDGNLVRYED